MLSLFRNDPFFRQRDVFSMEPFQFPRGMTPFKEWDWDMALAQPVSMNLEDMGKNYQMEVHAPEFGKDQLKIHVDEGVLTVEGQQSDIQGDEKDGSKYESYRKSSFVRKMTLPANIDENQISATHRDGKLYITFPKVDIKANTRRAINVQ